MKKTSAGAAVAVLTLLLSACGSNDDAKASQSLSDQFMKSQKSSAGGASQLLSLKQKDADCIGEGMVDKIGTDKLQKYGLLTKDLKASKDLTQVKMSRGDAGSATDVVFGCTDVPGMMDKAMTSSGQVPAEMRACMTKALSEDALRSMFTHVFSGDQETAQKDLVKPMMKCASPNGG